MSSPFLADTHQPHGSIGGGFFGGPDTAEVDSVRRALLERNPKELAKNLEKTLNDIVSVTVSLDGAFFDDGAFVGPDESQFFSKVKAQVDARYDLHRRIQGMFSAGKSQQRILKHVTDLANTPRVHLGRNSTPSEFYDFFRLFFAQEISRIWSVSGPDSASRFVETSISKPWPSLKKL